MTPSISAPALRLVRLPGEAGPILRCSGELSVATVEALRRELALLISLGHPVMTVNLAGCDFLDVEGILTLVKAFKQLHHDGRRMVLVGGTGRIGRLLRVMGIDWILPVFPSEEVAARALRGGGPHAPAPATWEAARAATVSRWRAIQEAVDQVPEEEVLRQLTSMTALCDRSEELFQQQPGSATARCEFCPLFYALDGRPQDLGCRSVLDPILAAVQQGEPEAARTRIAEMIHTLEEMSLPEGDDPPVPSQLIEAVRATGEHLPRDRKADRIDKTPEVPLDAPSGIR
jgi:anti-sigma B factor antagonist